MFGESPRRLWTIPNLLSLSRLALLPVFWWLMAQPDRRYWLWGGLLVVYGIISDILDGALARKLNQVSATGKILDPLADKITAGVVAIFCVLERGLPIWALVLTSSRDLVLLVGGRFLWKKEGELPTSLMFGKIAALLWALTLLLWVFDTQPLAEYVLWPVVIIYILAGLVYAHRLLKK